MNRKTTLIIVLSIAILALAAYFIFGKSKAPAASINPKNSVVVAFGDSLIKGYGSSDGKDFVSVLSADIGISIINEGKNGDTTVSALDRFDDVLAHDPGTVILLLGGNDFLKKVPIDTTFANLRKMIIDLKAHDVRVVLLGIRGGLLSDPFKARFEQLADEQDVMLVPDVLDGMIGDNSVMFDTIHPNDAGYAKVAKKVLPALRKTLGL